MTDSKPSKSRLKRDYRQRQRLGESLIGMSDSDLQSLPIDDRLRQAVRDAAKMTSRGALRRQRQLIGKLVNGIDTAPLEAALDARRAEAVREKRLFAAAERWRDRLVADGAAGLAVFERETGCQDDELRTLLGRLATATSEREEKTVLRAIFRSVHAILVKIRQ